MFCYIDVEYTTNGKVGMNSDNYFVCGSCHQVAGDHDLTSSTCMDCGTRVHYDCDTDSHRRGWHCLSCTHWG